MICVPEEGTYQKEQEKDNNQSGFQEIVMRKKMMLV